MDEDYVVPGPININFINLTLRNNFGGSAFYLERLPNVSIVNSSIESNIDSGENLYAWRFEDWSHSFSSWYHLPDLFYAESHCTGHFYVDKVYKVDIANVYFSDNECSGGTMIYLHEVFDKIRIWNLTLSNNQFSDQEGGALTINPLSSTSSDEPSQQNMPKILNSVFTGNINDQPSGDGAISIVSSFSYREYPVSLTVKDSVFEGNQGAITSAINWLGVLLEIEDTVFRDNKSIFGATIDFVHSA